MTQVGKNLVTLLVLVGIAAGLGLYAWYGVKEPEAREATKQEASEQLFATGAPGDRPAGGKASTAPPVFTHLTVTAKDGTTELAREDGVWRVTAPVSAKADAVTVEAITQVLASSKFKATVDDAPSDADLEKYGLKTPIFTVTARAFVPDARGGGADDPSRQRTVTLRGGIENTFDGSVYVQRDGEPKVYAADGTVRVTLDKDTFALRDKEFIAPLDEPSLQSIEVRAKANAYSLRRDGADPTWRLVKPVEVRADDAKVADLVNQLKGQRAQSFPADAPDARRKLGLETPVVDARFQSATGEPVRLRLSQVTEDGATHVYALREQGSRAVLAEVMEGALGVLDVGVPVLKSKRVLAFRRDDVRRIVFHPGGGAAPVTVARADGTGSWTVEAPEQGKAQHFKVVSLLGSLETLKASAFGDAKPRDWAKYGVGEASRGAALLGADGHELARVWLGHEVPEKPGTVYARGSGPDVLEVSATWVEWPDRAGDLLEPTAPINDAGPPAAATPAP